MEATIYLNQFDVDLIKRLGYKEEIESVINKEIVDIQENTIYRFLTKWSKKELETILYYIDMEHNLEFRCLRDIFQRSYDNIFRI